MRQPCTLHKSQAPGVCVCVRACACGCVWVCAVVCHNEKKIQNDFEWQARKVMRARYFKTGGLNAKKNTTKARCLSHKSITPIVIAMNYRQLHTFERGDGPLQHIVCEASKLAFLF